MASVVVAFEDRELRGRAVEEPNGPFITDVCAIVLLMDGEEAAGVRFILLDGPLDGHDLPSGFELPVGVKVGEEILQALFIEIIGLENIEKQRCAAAHDANLLADIVSKMVQRAHGPR